MSDLRIGDRVLAATRSGALQYQDVYMFGHADASKAAPYIHLATASGRTLRLTPDHYVPVGTSGEANLTCGWTRSVAS